MSRPNQGKRAKTTEGLKALIAAASVTATIAGWAMLPANDPAAASAAANFDNQQTNAAAPALPNVLPQPIPTQGPDFQAPDSTQSELPAVDTPSRGSRSGRLAPFTGTHSSR